MVGPDGAEPNQSLHLTAPHFGFVSYKRLGRGRQVKSLFGGQAGNEALNPPSRHRVERTACSQRTSIGP